MIRCKKRCGKKKWLEERNSQLFWQTKHSVPTGFRVLVWSQTTMSCSMLPMPCSTAPCPTTRVHNHAGLQRALLSLNGSDWHLGPPATCPAPSQSPCLPPPYSPTIVSHQPPNHKPPNSLTRWLALPLLPVCFGLLTFCPPTSLAFFPWHHSQKCGMTHGMIRALWLSVHPSASFVVHCPLLAW